MKSAVFCEHANESPLYEREGERLVCRCPEDCYCKHDGGCKGLRREVQMVPGGSLYFEGRLIASCPTDEALKAAERLFKL